MSVPVIDVHTHMLSEAWVSALRDHGGPKYEVKPTKMRPSTSPSPTQPTTLTMLQLQPRRMRPQRNQPMRPHQQIPKNPR